MNDGAGYSNTRINKIQSLKYPSAEIRSSSEEVTKHEITAFFLA